MENLASFEGFYAYIGGKDCFFVTDQRKKSINLYDKILRLIGENVCTQNENALGYCLRRATCDLKRLTCRDGKIMTSWSIHGDGFGGYGSDDANDGKTLVFDLSTDKLVEVKDYA